MADALAEARQALRNGEFPVGCVMVHGDEIVARGGREHSIGEVNELDHAEIVALRNLLSDYPDLDRSRVVVYSTLEPCLMCYAGLLLNGIRTIVYGYEDIMGGGCNLELQRLNVLYRDMKVELVPAILRQESLELFRTFFSNPDNRYWSDSPLSYYTLAQP